MDAKEFTISYEELHRLFKYKDGHLYWKIRNSNRIKIGDKAGTVAKRGNININISKRLYKAHRIIFFMHHKYLPPIIDHIDGNSLNNRIENLRPATELQNHHNVGVLKRNKSGVKGVCWDKSRNKWFARLNFNYKSHHAGYFDKIEEAKKAVELYRNQLHGSFAKHE
jgi:hypothetical protein